jgi:hypothetical protein
MLLREVGYSDAETDVLVAEGIVALSAGAAPQALCAGSG